MKCKRARASLFFYMFLNPNMFTLVSLTLANLLTFDLHSFDVPLATLLQNRVIYVEGVYPFSDIDYLFFALFIFHFFFYLLFKI